MQATKKLPYEKLDSYFLEYNKITEKDEYEIYDINAKDLLNIYRIDLVVKCYYIECREKNQNIDFAIELYKKHIEAFSDGTFLEHGNQGKNSIDKYIEVFDNLINTIKQKGYDSDISIIPIGKNNELLDGSHRVACAIYFNQNIRVIKFPKLSVNYGFKFFKARLLDEEYLDFIAKEYARLNDDIYLLFVWPRATSNRKLKVIENILEKNQCEVIYRKAFIFNKKQLENLIFHIYKDEHWIGHNKDNYKGIKLKTNQCYKDNGNVELYILYCSDNKKLITSKDEIRELLKMGKASIRTSDTKRETVEVLNTLLNKNYNSLLYNSFNRYKSYRYSFLRYLYRRLRYLYRKVINKIKHIIGKPV